MATVVIMPRQGQSVESCVITAFNKKVGDVVEKGDLIAESANGLSVPQYASISGTVTIEEGVKIIIDRVNK